MGLNRSPQQQLLAAAVACACMLAAALLPTAAAGEVINSRPGNVLCLILTDCSKYQDWQAVAAVFAWRHSGQPGSVVRVTNCDAKDTQNYEKKMLDYVKTHMAPQFSWNTELDDFYPAYNKPAAVVEYFKHNNPVEEWVVVLDSDMLLHKVFRPEELPLERGWVYAPYYDYVVGVDNQYAMLHVPDIAPRNDTKAGPVGRRGDQVGGPYYMHKDDLIKLAPQWYNWTRKMRTDTENKGVGNVSREKTGRIWIAEMYGYIFGAAKSNIWHYWKKNLMLYPGATPQTIPYVLHGCFDFRVGDWTFNKHDYEFTFDSHKCPPWNLTADKPDGGIFPPPPGPKQLESKEYLNWYKDMLTASAIATVNAGLCDYHVRNCDPSPQLTEVCNKAFQLFHEVDQEVKDLEWVFNCTHAKKEGWATHGECSKIEGCTSDYCQQACKQCRAQGPRPKGPNDKLYTVEQLSRDVGKEAAPPEFTVANRSTRPSKPPSPPTAQQAAGTIQQAAAQQQEQQQQQDNDFGETELRKKYPISMLSFAALVRRCTELQALSEKQTRECVKAASFHLEFPGYEVFLGRRMGGHSGGGLGFVSWLHVFSIVFVAAAIMCGYSWWQNYQWAKAHSRRIRTVAAGNHGSFYTKQDG